MPYLDSMWGDAHTTSTQRRGNVLCQAELCDKHDFQKAADHLVNGILTNITPRRCANDSGEIPFVVSHCTR